MQNNLSLSMDSYERIIFQAKEKDFNRGEKNSYRCVSCFLFYDFDGYPRGADGLSELNSELIKEGLLKVDKEILVDMLMIQLEINRTQHKMFMAERNL
jgi:hypothetical protein